VSVGDRVKTRGECAVAMTLNGGQAIDRQVEDADAVSLFRFANALLNLFKKVRESASVDEIEGHLGK
jgi:hypothetical protein